MLRQQLDAALAELSATKQALAQSQAACATSRKCLEAQTSNSQELKKRALPGSHVPRDAARRWPVTMEADATALASLGGVCNFTPPAHYGTRLNYSHIDFVILMLRTTCSTELSMRRLLYFYSPQRVLVVLGRNAVINGECAAVLAIDPRMRCMDESTVMQVNGEYVNRTSLSRHCSASRGLLERGGWYLQQILKIGVARHVSDLSEGYVIWESDNWLVYARELQRDGRSILAENANVRDGALRDGTPCRGTPLPLHALALHPLPNTQLVPLAHSAPLLCAPLSHIHRLYTAATFISTSPSSTPAVPCC